MKALKIILFALACVLTNFALVCVLFTVACVRINNHEWQKLNNEGLKLLDYGKYSEALPILEKAKLQARIEFGEKAASYATSLISLAVLYSRQGLYAKADPLMIEAKEIYAKTLGKNHPDYATSLNNLASLYIAQGLYAKAQPLCVEAKEIVAKVLGKEHPDYARSLNNLAHVYNAQGLYVKAEPLYIEAKEIRAKVLGKEHPDYAASLDNLAHSYYDKGFYAKAEPLYTEAKDIRAKALGREHPVYALSLDNLASLYQCQGFYAKAEPLYMEAKGIRAKVLGKEHLVYALSLNSLAGLYQDQNLYTKAEPLFIESKDIILKSLLNNFSNLSEKEKKQFLDAKFRYFENFYYLITTILQKEPTYKGLPNLLQNTFDLQLQIKGLLLAETQKIKKRILSSGDKELIAKFEAWGVLKNTIAKAYNLSVADRAKQGLAMPKLESEANELEKQLSARSEDFKEAFTPLIVSYQDIQKQLKEGEVAVEMIRTKYKNRETKKDDTVYLALVLTPKDLFPVLLKNGKDLEGTLLKKHRNSIRHRIIDTVSYRAFWQPIAEKLVGAKKVYFSPDGAYNSLNINTLFNPTTKKYIVEEYDLSILTNLKEMIAQKKPNATKKANLFGRPAYKMSKTEHEDNRRGVERGETSETESNFNITQMGFSDLVGTEVEVKGIDSVLRKNTWQTELTLGKQALEERVKQVKNPAILHIATHGYFVPSDGKSFANAMLNSGIVLAGVSSEKGANSEDGVLTAYEASSLDLDETDLVVLSACETGLGEVAVGEGVYGLQRGFKVAGAKAVIMSLWKVDDTATQELMNTFYSLWLSGKSKKEAFKEAQLQLKAKYQSPYYWGGFVMVGD